jgi:monofunctional biosynthetic peptidoglycan transglycosylase
MFSGIRRLTGRVLGTLSRFGNGLRWTLRIVLLLLIVDFFYLAVTWPDWKKLAAGPVPKSAFMFDYERGRTEHKDWPALRWQPVPFAAIPKTLARAVILAEDSRFYEHSGFDLIAFKEAMQYNLGKGRFALGASTISQQTVKNLLLSSSKNPLRKWHELLLTWGMEQNLTKHRILEIYLNVAEFGPGIYGVQAAAQSYFGVNAADLTVPQAAELAATLPSPLKNNPATRTKWFENRVRKILTFLTKYPGDAAEAVATFQFETVPDAAPAPTEDAGAVPEALPPKPEVSGPAVAGPI